MLLHVQYQKFDLNLDLVFLSPMEIIWSLGYHVALMEERGQLKQDTIFGCFVRVIGMTSMGTVGSHSHASGKASLRLSYHCSCSG